MTIAFLFPGQGAQYIGMGKELYNSYGIVKKTFDQADEILGEALSELIFNGSERDLMKTENTQPGILTLSTAIARLLESLGVSPSISAGLSLGEYGALTFSGVIHFESSLPLVRKRGQIMQEAVPAGKGGMAAIIGLDEQKLKACLSDAGQDGLVQIANYNCPGQLVISGDIGSVNKACKLTKLAGAKRAIPLQVSGPFHSSLLRPAGERLIKELDKIELASGRIPVVANVTAKPTKTTSEVKDLLIKQVSNPVKWEDSIRYILSTGVDTFIEMGPGRALSGFMRKIDRTAKVFNVEDIKTLESTLHKLEGRQ
ncbi:MAG TPA: ACP S-malonyltransferase [Bacillota bacterium]|nr:ACP S-malonyltransferase [Bacillota bacterium]